MNGKAKTVLWLGLAMLMFQVYVAWPSIRQVLFTSNTTPQSGSGSPGFPILIPGLPPLFGVPPVKVPGLPPIQLSQTGAKGG